ncbi:MAG: hypothetical protein PUB11_03645 [Oscillospiraceae bacterium]|nr:hypothetical protein [Oscillospiraceae bacterium]
MKKLKLPLLTLLVGVLMFSGIQGTKAYKVYKTTDNANSTFTIEAKTEEHSISIDELDLTNAMANATKEIGKTVELSSPKATNGPSDQYVRMVITKTVRANDVIVKDGGKLFEIGVADGWIKSNSESTDEREVYYFGTGNTLNILGAGTEIDTVNSFRINSSVYRYTTENKKDDQTYTTTFWLDKAVVDVTISVEGIQTHNAADAALDAWGVSGLTFSDTVVGEEG